MDSLHLLRDKFKLRYLELRQIGLLNSVFKIPFYLEKKINFFFLDNIREKIFLQSEVKLQTLTFNVNRKFYYEPYVKNFKKFKNLIYYANYYLKENYFSNLDFKKIEEKKFEDKLVGIGFKCPIIHDFRVKTDLRPIWDKVRSHHFLCLYLTYLITKDKRYYNKLIDEIEIHLNKKNYLKNYLWSDALNLSIRSINILTLLQIIKKKDKELKKKIMRLYLITCEGISLTRSKKTSIINNHYFCESLALVLFFNLTNDRIKLEREFKNFKNCIMTIFYRNGCNYEGSLLYQRLLLEFLLISQYFWSMSGQKKDHKKEMISLIKKIWGYSHNITGENGVFKQFGDVDFTQVIKVDTENVFKINELNNLYEYLVDIKKNIKSLISLYLKPHKKNNQFNHKKEFYGLPGYSRIKFENNFEMWIDTDYPGLGKKGVGGHGHNDVTSIIIDLNGKEFICDHGISSYFVDIRKRNFERSSFNHNVINRKGFQQSRLLEKFFLEPGISEIDLLKKNNRGILSLVVAYKIKYSDDVILNCKRKIFYNSNILKIIDIIISKSDVELNQTWNFNLEKFLFKRRNELIFKDCYVSYLSEIKKKSSSSIKTLNHYKNAYKQLKLILPLKQKKINSDFTYYGQLKLDIQ